MTHQLSSNYLFLRRILKRWAGVSIVAFAWMSSVVMGCGASNSARNPAAADPAHQSVAEYDIARDLFVVRGRAREGLEHALKAVELDESNAEAAHLVSLIYLYFCASSTLDCRMAEAQRYAQAAVQLNPKFREAINTLAVVYVHQRRYDDAIGLLQPLSNDILYATPEIAWGNLGWAYLLKGDFDKAIDSLHRVLALQPDFCVGAYRLALAYERKGQQQAAHQAVTRAIDTDRPECKNFQEAFQTRARVAMRLGDRDGARDDLHRCRELDSQTEVGKQCDALLQNMK